MKKLKRFWILLRYWKTIQTIANMMEDPESKYARNVMESLSEEEEEGFNVLYNVYRLLYKTPIKELKDNLNHCQDIVAGNK